MELVGAPVLPIHPNALVLTKGGGCRQHRHHLHAAALREQLEQNQLSSSLLPAPPLGHRELPWPCSPQSQPVLSPATAGRCRALSCSAPPPRGPGGLTQTYRNSACCHELSPPILLNI